MIAQPDKIHFGRLSLNPIFAKKLVIISTGQTIHQRRPKNIDRKTIAGHQTDQTIRFPRFVFLSCFKKTVSSENARKPNIINAMYAINDNILKTKGKIGFCNK